MTTYMSNDNAVLTDYLSMMMEEEWTECEGAYIYRENDNTLTIRANRVTMILTINRAMVNEYEDSAQITMKITDYATGVTVNEYSAYIHGDTYDDFWGQFLKYITRVWNDGELSTLDNESETMGNS